MAPRPDPGLSQRCCDNPAQGLFGMPLPGRIDCRDRVATIGTTSDCRRTAATIRPRTSVRSRYWARCRATSRIPVSIAPPRFGGIGRLPELPSRTRPARAKRAKFSGPRIRTRTSRDRTGARLPARFRAPQTRRQRILPPVWYPFRAAVSAPPNWAARSKTGSQQWEPVSNQRDRSFENDCRVARPLVFSKLRIPSPAPHR